MRVCVRVAPPPTLVGMLGDQLGDAYTQRGVITVGDDKRLVYCPEPDLSNILSFQFDRAFDESAATTSVYQGTVLPLVNSVLEGHSATAIVCGEDAYGKSMMAEGDPGQLIPGFVSLAAETIFAGLEQEPLRDGSGSIKVVRVSWYELGRGGVRDLLGAASGVAPKSPQPTDKLRLRDDPQVGVTLPHLLEVEVKSASDVGELIRSLRRTGYGTPGTPRTAFSVFTITIEGISIKRYDSAKGSPRAGRADALAPRARMSFMMLPEVSAGDGGSGGDAVPSWVRGLHAVLEGMEAKSPAIPFHRTRTTLLLRDSLVGRMPSVMIAVVSPNIDAAAASGATLKFASRVRAVTRREYLTGDAGPVEPRPGTHGDKRLGSSAGPGGGGGALVPPDARSRGYYDAGARSGAGGGTARGAWTNGVVGGGGGGGGGDDDGAGAGSSDRYARGSPRGARAPQSHRTPVSRRPVAPPAPPNSITARAVKALAPQLRDDAVTVPGDYQIGSARRDEGLTALTPRASRHRMDSAESGGRDGAPAGGEASPRGRFDSAGSGGGSGAGAGGGGGSPGAYSRSTGAAGAGAGASSAAGFPLDEGSFSTDPLGRAEAIAARMAALSSQGDESAKWFTAMLSALEVSREETRSLRQRAGETARQFAELQYHRDHLQQKLDMATAELDAAKRANVAPAHFLQTRALKEKLSAARQEIKDYELYKDVMETAVVRLKGEMQKLVDEREAARKDASRASGHARREREQAINVKELEGELVKAQLSAEGKISRAKASVRNQEQSLVAMRDQVLADNERLLRELQSARDKLLAERRRNDKLEATVARLQDDAAQGPGANAALTSQLEELRAGLEVAEESNARLKDHVASMGEAVLADAVAAGAITRAPSRDVGVGMTPKRVGFASAMDRAETSRSEARRAMQRSSQSAAEQRNAGSRGREAARDGSGGNRGTRGARVRGGGGTADHRMYDVTKSVARGMTKRMAARNGNARAGAGAGGAGARGSDDAGAGGGGASGPAARARSAGRGGGSGAGSIAQVAPHHKALVAGLKRDMAAMREPEVPVRHRQQTQRARRRTVQ